MRSAPACWLVFGSALVLSTAGGCGGKVVVDGLANAGGAGGFSGQVGAGGGQGPSGGQGGMLPEDTSSSTLSGPGCNFPTAKGSVHGCSATGSSGPGTPVTCGVLTCDEENNSFLSSCDPQTCICSYAPSDGSEPFGCTCSNTAGCGPGARSCCPFHF